ncbi:MAG: hypothetical protein HRT37_04335 [Alteromonadaceae bacterium]|nr:hypothetical protein [Alteromonadaceae bacterium]
MNGTTMVVLIVFISVGFGVIADLYKRHLAFKEKTLNHNVHNDEQNISLKKQITSLEERMQVLEKIVTDEGYSVQKEINNL